MGRTFTTNDDREGAQPTVVVTHEFWTNVLGADVDVIGSGVTLTGVDFIVIGVLPASFVCPQGVDVFTALGTRPGLANNRTVFLQTLGRLVGSGGCLTGRNRVASRRRTTGFDSRRSGRRDHTFERPHLGER